MTPKKYLRINHELTINSNFVVLFRDHLAQLTATLRESLVAFLFGELWDNILLMIWAEMMDRHSGKVHQSIGLSLHKAIADTDSYQ